jgi:hypothetical protein
MALLTSSKLPITSQRIAKDRKCKTNKQKIKIKIIRATSSGRRKDQDRSPTKDCDMNGVKHFTTL